VRVTREHTGQNAVDRSRLDTIVLDLALETEDRG
jgi:hypothetical protein